MKIQFSSSKTKTPLKQIKFVAYPQAATYFSSQTAIPIVRSAVYCLAHKRNPQFLMRSLTLASELSEAASSIEPHTPKRNVIRSMETENSLLFDMVLRSRLCILYIYVRSVFDYTAFASTFKNSLTFAFCNNALWCKVQAINNEALCLDDRKSQGVERRKRSSPLRFHNWQWWIGV